MCLLLLHWENSRRNVQMRWEGDVTSLNFHCLLHTGLGTVTQTIKWFTPSANTMKLSYFSFTDKVLRHETLSSHCLAPGSLTWLGMGREQQKDKQTNRQKAGSGLIGLFDEGTAALKSLVCLSCAVNIRVRVVEDCWTRSEGLWDTDDRGHRLGYPRRNSRCRGSVFKL